MTIDVTAPTADLPRAGLITDRGETIIAPTPRCWRPGATAAGPRHRGYPGVRSARARLLGDHPAAEVEITVDVHDGADVPALRRRIEEHALARFRQALELADLRSQVHVRLAEPAGRTVR